MPLLFTAHPLGGERPASVSRRAQQAYEQLPSLIAGGRSGSGVTGSATEVARSASEVARVGATTSSNRPPTSQAGLAGPATTIPAATDPADLPVDDDPNALLLEFSNRQWSDGLPIVPPTPERVAAMLGGRDGSRSLGPMPPVWRLATLEKLAIN